MRQLNSRTERENQPDLLAGGSIMTTAQTIESVRCRREELN